MKYDLNAATSPKKEDQNEIEVIVEAMREEAESIEYRVDEKVSAFEVPITMIFYCRGVSESSLVCPLFLFT